MYGNFTKYHHVRQFFVSHVRFIMPLPSFATIFCATCTVILAITIVRDNFLVNIPNHPNQFKIKIKNPCALRAHRSLVHEVHDK